MFCKVVVVDSYEETASIHTSAQIETDVLNGNGTMDISPLQV